MGKGVRELQGKIGHGVRSPDPSPHIGVNLVKGRSAFDTEV